MVFYKLFGNLTPVDEFAGLDIRFITGMMAVLAAFGLAFACHLIQLAFKKEEEAKKLDESVDRKKPQPKFDELYQTGKLENTVREPMEKLKKWLNI